MHQKSRKERRKKAEDIGLCFKERIRGQSAPYVSILRFKHLRSPEPLCAVFHLAVSQRRNPQDDFPSWLMSASWRVSVFCSPLFLSDFSDPAAVIFLLFFPLLRLRSFQSPHQECGVSPRGPGGGAAVRNVDILGR